MNATTMIEDRLEVLRNTRKDLELEYYRLLRHGESTTRNDTDVKITNAMIGELEWALSVMTRTP